MYLSCICVSNLSILLMPQRSIVCTKEKGKRDGSTNPHKLGQIGYRMVCRNTTLNLSFLKVGLGNLSMVGFDNGSVVGFGN